MVSAPRILSLATAVPAHPLPQQAMRDFTPQLFPNRPAEKLEPLLSSFDSAGIETRQICVPMEWLAQPHSWPERTRLYRRHAVALIREVAEKALDEAGLAPEDIDALVVASTTGIATPSLDALLMEELPFRRDVTRLPLFGFGCAGGALGMARAAQLARAMPGARVLFLVVELCSLTFRVGDPTKSNVIAAALFGDGAAGAVIGPGEGPEITATGEWTWPNSLAVMGWRVERDSFGVLFSRHIPGIIENDLPPVLGRFLAQHALTIADFDAFAVHPGGTKILAAYEKAFGLSPECLAPARRVIREHGNMSSATALFVLRELWNEPFRRCLLMAPGPGFSVGFVVLER